MFQGEGSSGSSMAVLGFELMPFHSVVEGLNHGHTTALASTCLEVLTHVYFIIIFVEPQSWPESITSKMQRHLMLDR